jgi:outer membrane protein OmpA-like peptidoglycan-associated protein
MSTLRFKPLHVLAGLGLAAWASPAHAQSLKADVDPPVIEHIEDTTNVEVIAPTNTMQGTRGLSQTASAEALGEGRLVLGLNGPWYRQQRNFAGAPNAKADIFTGIGSLAYGISRQWDIFASVTAWGTQNYSSSQGSGLGTVGGGVQGTLPFTPTAPIRMGAQLGVFNGLSDDPINSNFADGYNYFETRTGLDFRGLLIQTLVFGSEGAALKAHFNEGVATSMENGVEPLLLLNTGLQMNVPLASVGLELHSRTALNDVAFNTDPLWLTPSVQFRTLHSMNITLGGDVALSQERSSSTSVALRALEPYRVFGGIAFTFDTQAEKRRQEKMEALRASRERERLRTQAVAAATKAREDSIAAANANAQITNITVENETLAAQRRQDSLAMADKARQDSAALADARQRLEAEKSKRSELENRLLTTGVLVMDAVYFETGKADISINSKPYLDMLAKVLVKYPKLQIEVAGHTDNVGSDAYNMNLSQARAMSVMTYLVGQAPELSGRLTAHGYGESMAKADNSSAEGRKMNRRTELQVLNKQALREYNEPVQSAATGASPAGTGASPSGGTQAGSGSSPSSDSTRTKTPDPGSSW